MEVMKGDAGGIDSSSKEKYFYLGILWYTIYSKIISSFWGIVFYIRNIILPGSTTKNTTHVGFEVHARRGRKLCAESKNRQERV